MFNLSTQEVVWSIEKAPLVNLDGKIFQQYENFFGENFNLQVLEESDYVKVTGQEHLNRVSLAQQNEEMKKIRIFFMNSKITEALGSEDLPDATPEPSDTQPEDPDGVAIWQARYLEVVGRPTGSSNIRYLRWKIRQAERGLVPVGPTGHNRTGEPVEHKVLPLRLAADAVAGLDEARERQGLKSRMELFRRALHLYLTRVGEHEAAEPFAPRT